jgi:hypothetical protein
MCRSRYILQSRSRWILEAWNRHRAVQSQNQHTQYQQYKKKQPGVCMLPRAKSSCTPKKVPKKSNPILTKSKLIFLLLNDHVHMIQRITYGLEPSTFGATAIEQPKTNALPLRQDSCCWMWMAKSEKGQSIISSPNEFRQAERLKWPIERIVKGGTVQRWVLKGGGMM